MNRNTKGIQKYIHTERERQAGHTYIHRAKHTDRHTGRQTIHTERQIYKPTERQTESQDSQPDRQHTRTPKCRQVGINTDITVNTER